MKLIFAVLLLLSTVISSELSAIINVASTDMCIMDTSYEGEVEKDVSESVEDVSKVKIKQEINFGFLSNTGSNDGASLKWLISTPYLEIHSPPPDKY